MHLPCNQHRAFYMQGFPNTCRLGVEALGGFVGVVDALTDQDVHSTFILLCLISYFGCFGASVLHAVAAEQFQLRQGR
jgi:hypothetical protein